MFSHFALSTRASSQVVSGATSSFTSNLNSNPIVDRELDAFALSTDAYEPIDGSNIDDPQSAFQTFVVVISVLLEQIGAGDNLDFRGRRQSI